MENHASYANLDRVDLACVWTLALLKSMTSPVSDTCAHKFDLVSFG